MSIEVAVARRLLSRMLGEVNRVVLIGMSTPTAISSTSASRAWAGAMAAVGTARKLNPSAAKEKTLTTRIFDGKADKQQGAQSSGTEHLLRHVFDPPRIGRFREGS